MSWVSGTRSLLTCQTISTTHYGVIIIIIIIIIPNKSPHQQKVNVTRHTFAEDSCLHSSQREIHIDILICMYTYIVIMICMILQGYMVYMGIYRSQHLWKLKLFVPYLCHTPQNKELTPWHHRIMFAVRRPHCAFCCLCCWPPIPSKLLRSTGLEHMPGKMMISRQKSLIWFF